MQDRSKFKIYYAQDNSGGINTVAPEIIHVTEGGNIGFKGGKIYTDKRDIKDGKVEIKWIEGTLHPDLKPRSPETVQEVEKPELPAEVKLDTIPQHLHVFIKRILEYFHEEDGAGIEGEVLLSIDLTGNEEFFAKYLAQYGIYTFKGKDKSNRYLFVQPRGKANKVRENTKLFEFTEVSASRETTYTPEMEERTKNALIFWGDVAEKVKKNPKKTVLGKVGHGVLNFGKKLPSAALQAFPPFRDIKKKMTSLESTGFYEYAPGVVIPGSGDKAGKWKIKVLNDPLTLTDPLTGLKVATLDLTNNHDDLAYIARQVVLQNAGLPYNKAVFDGFIVRYCYGGEREYFQEELDSEDGIYKVIQKILNIRYIAADTPAIAEAERLRKRSEGVFNIHRLADIVTTKDLMKSALINGTRGGLMAGGALTGVAQAAMIDAILGAGQQYGELREKKMKSGENTNMVLDVLAPMLIGGVTMGVAGSLANEPLNQLTKAGLKIGASTFSATLVATLSVIPILTARTVEEKIAAQNRMATRMAAYSVGTSLGRTIQILTPLGEGLIKRIQSGIIHQQVLDGIAPEGAQGELVGLKLGLGHVPHNARLVTPGLNNIDQPNDIAAQPTPQAGAAPTPTIRQPQISGQGIVEQIAPQPNGPQIPQQAGIFKLGSKADLDNALVAAAKNSGQTDIASYIGSGGSNRTIRYNFMIDLESKLASNPNVAAQIQNYAKAHNMSEEKVLLGLVGRSEVDLKSAGNNIDSYLNTLLDGKHDKQLDQGANIFTIDPKRWHSLHPAWYQGFQALFFGGPNHINTPGGGGGGGGPVPLPAGLNLPGAGGGALNNLNNVNNNPWNITGLDDRTLIGVGLAGLLGLIGVGSYRTGRLLRNTRGQVAAANQAAQAAQAAQQAAAAAAQPQAGAAGNNPGGGPQGAQNPQVPQNPQVIPPGAAPVGAQPQVAPGAAPQNQPGGANNININIGYPGIPGNPLNQQNILPNQPLDPMMAQMWQMNMGNQLFMMIMLLNLMNNQGNIPLNQYQPLQAQIQQLQQALAALFANPQQPPNQQQLNNIQQQIQNLQQAIGALQQAPAANQNQGGQGGQGGNQQGGAGNPGGVPQVQQAGNPGGAGQQQGGPAGAPVNPVPGVGATPANATPAQTAGDNPLDQTRQGDAINDQGNQDTRANMGQTQPSRPVNPDTTQPGDLGDTQFNRTNPDANQQTRVQTGNPQQNFDSIQARIRQINQEQARQRIEGLLARIVGYTNQMGTIVRENPPAAETVSRGFFGLGQVRSTTRDPIGDQQQGINNDINNIATNIDRLATQVNTLDQNQVNLEIDNIVRRLNGIRDRIKEYRRDVQTENDVFNRDNPNLGGTDGISEAQSESIEEEVSNLRSVFFEQEGHIDDLTQRYEDLSNRYKNELKDFNYSTKVRHMPTVLEAIGNITERLETLRSQIFGIMASDPNRHIQELRTAMAELNRMTIDLEAHVNELIDLIENITPPKGTPPVNSSTSQSGSNQASPGPSTGAGGGAGPANTERAAAENPYTSREEFERRDRLIQRYRILEQALNNALDIRSDDTVLLSIQRRLRDINSEILNTTLFIDRAQREATIVDLERRLSFLEIELDTWNRMNQSAPRQGQSPKAVSNELIIENPYEAELPDDLRNMVVESGNLSARARQAGGDMENRRLEFTNRRDGQVQGLINDRVPIRQVRQALAEFRAEIAQFQRDLVERENNPTVQPSSQVSGVTNEQGPNTQPESPAANENIDTRQQLIDSLRTEIAQADNEVERIGNDQAQRGRRGFFENRSRALNTLIDILNEIQRNPSIRDDVIDVLNGILNPEIENSIVLPEVPRLIRDPGVRSNLSNFATYTELMNKYRESANGNINDLPRITINLQNL